MKKEIEREVLLYAPQSCSFKKPVKINTNISILEKFFEVKGIEKIETEYNSVTIFYKESQRVITIPSLLDKMETLNWKVTFDNKATLSIESIEDNNKISTYESTKHYFGIPFQIITLICNGNIGKGE